MGIIALKRVWKFGLLSVLTICANAQAVNVNPKLLQGSWSAQWINYPQVSSRAYGVYHFRKEINLNTIPSKFIVHVSADNRYILYVNGQFVGRGPARSSLFNWNFASYDIASYLRPGNNLVSSIVWNMGEYAPVAQISNQTAFLLQGDTKAEEILNTNKTWKVYQNKAYSPGALEAGKELQSYFVVGPGDLVKGDLYPWGWETSAYSDKAWLSAKELNTPVVTSGYGTDNQWVLSPSMIPPMEETMQRMVAIRRGKGLRTNDFLLQGKKPLIIPAHTKGSFLVDQSFETVAYPVLKVSGGKGASVRLTYSEALVDSNFEKGNRNDIAGKEIKGLYDVFYPDGGKDRSFSPLWLRTFRYVQLDIQTGSEALILNDLYSMFTGYPFEHTATFESNDASLKDIWNVGWRTARLCAGETYYDCPYYEQLQYEGDTRIQSLISLYNSGDDRLMRKAIDDFFISRVPEGLTQGRFPSNRIQVIPPFSLYWVSMLYDYWMHQPDTVFIKKYLDAATLVLKWYEQHIDENFAMLGPMKWWNFTDWNLDFKNGVPDGATDGHSSVITLQFAYTLQQAGELFEYFGDKQKAQHYQSTAKRLAKSTYDHCFNPERMIMANTPLKNSYSQHAGIIAILAGAISASEEKQVLQTILSDTSLSQATFYYRFYLTRAMIKAGLGDLYYSQLEPWRDMLAIGLTTFAENPDPTRSDCHAWSASPIYDFLATICGIMPDAPGFQKVKIAPHLGELIEVSASMPSPQGTISVTLKRKLLSDGIEGEIILPENLKGNFLWRDKEIELIGGTQKIDIN